jgi:hypothetical protein
LHIAECRKNNATVVPQYIELIWPSAQLAEEERTLSFLMIILQVLAHMLQQILIPAQEMYEVEV